MHIKDYIKQNFSYSLDTVEFLDVESIQRMKEYDIAEYGNLPDDHGVWMIGWDVNTTPNISAAFVAVTQCVDEMTGQIVWEGIMNWE